jgi:CheY-like chemotaxis protein
MTPSPTRDLVQTVMHYHGHETVEYRGGVQALEGLKTEHPDVVLADVMMPVMDGYQLASAIHANPETRDLPVIFYTANYQAPNVVSDAHAAGVSRIVPKTGDLTELVDAIESSLREVS